MDKLALDAGGRERISIADDALYVQNPLYGGRDPIPVEVLQAYMGAEESSRKRALVKDLQSGLKPETLVAILNNCGEDQVKSPAICMPPDKMLEHLVTVKPSHITEQDVLVSRHILSCCRDAPDWLTAERKKEIASAIRRYWILKTNLSDDQQKQSEYKAFDANIDSLAKVIGLKEGPVCQTVGCENVVRQLVEGEDRIFVVQRRTPDPKEPVRVVELIDSHNPPDLGSRQLLFTCREEREEAEPGIKPHVDWTKRDLATIYAQLCVHFSLGAGDTVCFNLPRHYESDSSDELSPQIVPLPGFKEVKRFPRHLRDPAGLARLRSLAFSDSGQAANTRANFIADFLEVEGSMKQLKADIDNQIEDLKAHDPIWVSIQKLVSLELQTFSRADHLVREAHTDDDMRRLLANRKSRVELLTLAVNSKDCAQAILAFTITFGDCRQEDLKERFAQSLAQINSTNRPLMSAVANFLVTQYEAAPALTALSLSFADRLGGVIAGYSMPTEMGLLPLTPADKLMRSSPYFSPAAELLIFPEHGKKNLHIDPTCSSATFGALTTSLPHSQAFKDHGDYIKCGRCGCCKSAAAAAAFVVNFRANRRSAFDCRIIQPGSYPPVDFPS